jgi:hypothetical protein
LPDPWPRRAFLFRAARFLLGILGLAYEYIRLLELLKSCIHKRLFQTEKPLFFMLGKEMKHGNED